MRKYDLYIPIAGTSIGGPNTFLKNFHSMAKELNCSFDQVVKCNIFFPISYDISTLDSIKKKGGIIIQRLDGIYYPEKHGDKFALLNNEIEVIYKDYASHIIFQSNYSKKQCFEMFGPKENYSIICNGVNKTIFRNKNSRRLNKHTTFITTGNFRNIDMLEPVIRALDLIIDSYDFKLIILGPVPNETLMPFLERSYCEYYGSITKQEEIASFLQLADAFIYSHLNPPCPNSVLEAISCGLPVIGYDSGSMSELCYFNKDLLGFVSDKVFHSYEDFDTEILVQKIELFLKNPEHYTKIAKANTDAYSMKGCVMNYLQTFESVGVPHTDTEVKFYNRIFQWRNK